MSTRDTDTPCVSVLQFIALCWPPVISLMFLATIPATRLSTAWKQVIATPVIIGVIVAPISVHTHVLVVDVISAALIAGLCHRLVDVFYIRPILYKQPACITWEQFNRDLTSAQYNYKQAKIDSEKNGDNKSNVTVRSCFYLVPKFVAAYVFTDVLGAFLTTYSREDVFEAEKYDTKGYFLIYVTGLMAASMAFVYGGAAMQFIAAVFSGGTYVEVRLVTEHWKYLMDRPYTATSLANLWSKRWHQVFRDFWLSIPYHPVRILSTRYLKRLLSDDLVKSLSMALSTIAVFFASGCMHEYINMTMLGKTAYTKYAGYEIKFFVSHGVAVVLEKMFSESVTRHIPDRRSYTWIKSIVGWLWVVLFTFYTFPWFFASFTEIEIWHLLTKGLTKNHVYNYARRTPWLKKLCGSLL